MYFGHPTILTTSHAIYIYIPPKYRCAIDPYAFKRPNSDLSNMALYAKNYVIETQTSILFSTEDDYVRIKTI
jgi:hypothetical protein